MIKYIRLFIAVQSQKRLSGTGNVYRILFHRQYNGREDDLSYDYGNEGNRLLSITDNGQGADQYDVIEYHNSNIQADTTFRYDANGNLIYDLDRGISVIKYNILNLPDTIQFSNGNQIVNLYDAAGRKYKTITYFAPETAGTSHYEIEHYTFDTDTVTYAVTEYAGNIETLIGVDSTITRRLHNTIGYYTDSTYYHYIKDHLGNICAVVNSVKDSVIQSTLYYASGVPMAQSIGRDKQPYLYNGKEFVEAHGWNTYDYGFRGYYATIGRFTSIDPLAEQTPWQSPYAYANNNFINAIDWMGLGGTTSFTNENVVHCIVVDVYGDIIGLANDGDNNIYIDLDGEWDPSEGKGSLIWVCEMEHPYMWYMSRAIAAVEGGGGKFRAVSPNQIATAIGRSLIRDVALGVADSYLRDGIGKAMGTIGDKTTLVVAGTRIAINAYNIFVSFISKGYNNQAAYDLAKEALSIGIKLILDGGTIKGATAITSQVATTAVTIAPYVMATAGVALAGWSYYKAGEYLMNMFWTIDRALNSPQFWGFYYGYPNDKQNW